ncbi:MAG: hypothetical protein WCI61_10355, partial [Chloroflexota bacterium]
MHRVDAIDAPEDVAAEVVEARHAALDGVDDDAADAVTAGHLDLPHQGAAAIVLRLDGEGGRGLAGVEA